MILFRSCPKCRSGDLVKTMDAFGAYMECAQCGYVRHIEPTPEEVEPEGLIIPFPALSDEEGPPRSA